MRVNPANNDYLFRAGTASDPPPQHEIPPEHESPPQHAVPESPEAVRESGSPNADVLPARAGAEHEYSGGIPHGSIASENTANPFGGDSKPKDNSALLTRRLVSASGQFEVRQVIADASKELAELHMLAATAKGSDRAFAKACIKKLDKLIGRAGKKISDLNGEDILKLQKARAQRRKQRERAEELKNELRKRQRTRMYRENGYLLGLMRDDLTGESSAGFDTASEAQIAIQAESIAAAEFSAAGPSSSSFDGAAAAQGSADLPQSDFGAASPDSPASDGIDITA